MCSVCKQVEGLSTGDALQVIGGALVGVTSQKQRDHLVSVADALFEPGEGDEAGEGDPELAGEWERSYRSGWR